MSDDRLASGAIYPPVGDLRRAARTIAVAVVRHLRDGGYGRQYRDEEIEPAVDRAIWWPEYLPFVPDKSAWPQCHWAALGSSLVAHEDVTFDPVASVAPRPTLP